tara:strand:- start:144 stop:485 length:342 start_codon:yes stop_codon:yes gene_type:complete
MNLSSENIIWNAQNWWDISRPNCDEDAIRDILHDGSLRSDLTEQFSDATEYFWDWESETLEKDPESPDSEDVECVARVIEQLVECHLAGDTPDIGSLNAVINFATSEFEASRT